MYKEVENRITMDKDLFLNYIETYSGISAMVKEVSYQEILRSAAEQMNMFPEKLEEFPMGGYSKGGLSGASWVLKLILSNIPANPCGSWFFCVNISYFAYSAI